MIRVGPPAQRGGVGRFAGPAVSGKAGSAHGEPFVNPCGEWKGQICSREDGIIGIKRNIG